MSPLGSVVVRGDAGQQIHSLYREHHRWLSGWLRRRLGNDSLALDLAQEAFVRLLGGGFPVEAIRTPRAYLATIAHGLVVNHWRRQAIERTCLETLATRGDYSAPSPQQARLALETLERIAALLDGLPPRLRSAFLLSQLEGWTYPRIAAHLCVSVNVVQKAMSRALHACYRVVHG